jgi:hypothetical protein
MLYLTIFILQNLNEGQSFTAASTSNRTILKEFYDFLLTTFEKIKAQISFLQSLCVCNTSQYKLNVSSFNYSSVIVNNAR